AETADAGTVLNSLGGLYIDQGRFDQARTTLDRAALIYACARDVIPMDHIALLNTQAALVARQCNWRAAEQHLRDGLSLSGRETFINPVAWRSLLNNFAQDQKITYHREARAIQIRVTGLNRRTSSVVDVGTY